MYLQKERVMKACVCAAPYHSQEVVCIIEGEVLHGERILREILHGKAEDATLYDNLSFSFSGKDLMVSFAGLSMIVKLENDGRGQISIGSEHFTIEVSAK
jgi:hypothetical protein